MFSKIYEGFFGKQEKLKVNVYSKESSPTEVEVPFDNNETIDDLLHKTDVAVKEKTNNNSFLLIHNIELKCDKKVLWQDMKIIYWDDCELAANHRLDDVSHLILKNVVQLISSNFNFFINIHKN